MIDHRGIASPRLVRLLLTVVAIGTGCDVRPRAPALRDSSVYYNRTAGLRFMVPQGWTQVANSALPSGALAAELMLVKYQMKTTARGAALEVLCFDAPNSTDLAAHHAQPSHGISAWAREEEPAPLTVDGQAGQRIRYQGRIDKTVMYKDVTVFLREGRVFSFVGLYWDDDRNAREEIHRAIASVVW